MRVFNFFLVVVLLLFCHRMVLAAPSLSDSDAKVLFDSIWKKPGGSIKVVPLGNFTVVQKGRDVGKGLISMDFFKDLIGWEKVGLIKLVSDKSLEDFRSGKRFEVDQFLQVTQNGVMAKITVSPTEFGKQFIPSDNENKLNIPQGRFTATSVAKNEERRKGVDEYRVVMVAYDAQFSQTVAQHNRIMGKNYSDKRKAIVLFKWDPFSKEWKPVAMDMANLDEQFKTKRVADFLDQ